MSSGSAEKGRKDVGDNALHILKHSVQESKRPLLLFCHGYINTPELGLRLRNKQLWEGCPTSLVVEIILASAGKPDMPCPGGTL